MKLPLFALPTALVAATLLAACGGGGGSSGGQPPTVSSTSASTATPMYSQTLVVTVNGNNLDQGLGGSSTGCSSITLGTTAPYVSTATTAYLKCTVAGVGAQVLNVTRSADGTTLATQAFTVAVPQVTLAVSNGAGVGGNVVITLAPVQSPITVNNFLAYVNSGFYNGTVFHRLVPGFVIQGGGYAAPLAVSPNTPALKPTNAGITLEDLNGLSNLQWTVAMARGSSPTSGTSQFFINLVDNPGLNGTSTTYGYAVFGAVTTGTDVVTAMAGAPCSPWPTFFGPNVTDCLPSPNLVVTGAVQTR